MALAKSKASFRHALGNLRNPQHFIRNRRADEDDAACTDLGEASVYLFRRHNETPLPSDRKPYMNLPAVDHNNAAQAALERGPASFSQPSQWAAWNTERARMAEPLLQLATSFCTGNVRDTDLKRFGTSWLHISTGFVLHRWQCDTAAHRFSLGWSAVWQALFEFHILGVHAPVSVMAEVEGVKVSVTAPMPLPAFDQVHCLTLPGSEPVSSMVALGAQHLAYALGVPLSTFLSLHAGADGRHYLVSLKFTGVALPFGVAVDSAEHSEMRMRPEAIAAARASGLALGSSGESSGTAAASGTQLLGHVREVLARRAVKMLFDVLNAKGGDANVMLVDGSVGTVLHACGVNIRLLPHVYFLLGEAAESPQRAALEEVIRAEISGRLAKAFIRTDMQSDGITTTAQRVDVVNRVVRLLMSRDQDFWDDHVVPGLSRKFALTDGPAALGISPATLKPANILKVVSLSVSCEYSTEWGRFHKFFQSGTGALLCFQIPRHVLEVRNDEAALNSMAARMLFDVDKRLEAPSPAHCAEVVRCCVTSLLTQTAPGVIPERLGLLSRAACFTTQQLELLVLLSLQLDIPVATAKKPLLIEAFESAALDIVKPMPGAAPQQVLEKRHDSLVICRVLAGTLPSRVTGASFCVPLFVSVLSSVARVASVWLHFSPFAVAVVTFLIDQLLLSSTLGSAAVVHQVHDLVMGISEQLAHSCPEASIALATRYLSALCRAPLVELDHEFMRRAGAESFQVHRAAVSAHGTTSPEALMSLYNAVVLNVSSLRDYKSTSAGQTHSALKKVIERTIEFDASRQWASGQSNVPLTLLYRATHWLPFVPPGATFGAAPAVRGWGSSASPDALDETLRERVLDHILQANPAFYAATLLQRVGRGCSARHVFRRRAIAHLRQQQQQQQQQQFAGTNTSSNQLRVLFKEASMRKKSEEVGGAGSDSDCRGAAPSLLITVNNIPDGSGSDDDDSGGGGGALRADSASSAFTGHVAAQLHAGRSDEMTITPAVSPRAVSASHEPSSGTPSPAQLPASTPPVCSPRFPKPALQQSFHNFSASTSSVPVVIDDSEIADRYIAYHREAMSADAREARRACTEFVAACNTCFNDICFRDVKRYEVVNEISVRRAVPLQCRNAAFWAEERQLAEQLKISAVEAVEELIATPHALPNGFTPNRNGRAGAPAAVLLSDDSLLDTERLTLLRVWRCRREAHRYALALRTASQACEDHFLSDLADAPVAVTVHHQGKIVTVTWLLPLYNDEPIRSFRGSVVEAIGATLHASFGAHGLGVAPLTAPLPLHGSADGRHYVLDTDQILLVKQRGFPRCPTDCTGTRRPEHLLEDSQLPDTRGDDAQPSRSRVVDVIVLLLADPRDVFKEAPHGALTKIFHTNGLNMSELYSVLTDAKIAGAESSRSKASFLKLCFTQMAGRALRAIIEVLVNEALLATAATGHTTGGPSADEAAGVVLDVCVRTVRLFLQSAAFLNKSIIPVIRAKFNTAKDFTFPPNAISVSNVLRIATGKWGISFDAGTKTSTGFCRATATKCTLPRSPAQAAPRDTRGASDGASCIAQLNAGASTTPPGLLTVMFSSAVRRCVEQRESWDDARPVFETIERLTDEQWRSKERPAFLMLRLKAMREGRTAVLLRCGGPVWPVWPTASRERSLLTAVTLECDALICLRMARVHFEVAVAARAEDRFCAGACCDAPAVADLAKQSQQMGTVSTAGGQQHERLRVLQQLTPQSSMHLALVFGRKISFAEASRGLDVACTLEWVLEKLSDTNVRIDISEFVHSNGLMLLLTYLRAVEDAPANAKTCEEPRVPLCRANAIAAFARCFSSTQQLLLQGPGSPSPAHLESFTTAAPEVMDYAAASFKPTESPRAIGLALIAAPTLARAVWGAAVSEEQGQIAHALAVIADAHTHCLDAARGKATREQFLSALFIPAVADALLALLESMVLHSEHAWSLVRGTASIAAATFSAHQEKFAMLSHSAARGMLQAAGAQREAEKRLREECEREEETARANMLEEQRRHTKIALERERERERSAAERAALEARGHDDERSGQHSEAQCELAAREAEVRADEEAAALAALETLLRDADTQRVRIAERERQRACEAHAKLAAAAAALQTLERDDEVAARAALEREAAAQREGVVAMHNRERGAGALRLLEIEEGKRRRALEADADAAVRDHRRNADAEMEALQVADERQAIAAMATREATERRAAEVDAAAQIRARDAERERERSAAEQERACRAADKHDDVARRARESFVAEETRRRQIVAEFEEYSRSHVQGEARNANMGKAQRQTALQDSQYGGGKREAKVLPGGASWVHQSHSITQKNSRSGGASPCSNEGEVELEVFDSGRIRFLSRRRNEVPSRSPSPVLTKDKVIHDAREFAMARVLQEIKRVKVEPITVDSALPIEEQIRLLSHQRRILADLVRRKAKAATRHENFVSPRRGIRNLATRGESEVPERMTGALAALSPPTHSSSPIKDRSRSATLVRTSVGDAAAAAVRTASVAPAPQRVPNTLTVDDIRRRLDAVERSAEKQFRTFSQMVQRQSTKSRRPARLPKLHLGH